MRLAIAARRRARSASSEDDVVPAGGEGARREGCGEVRIGLDCRGDAGLAVGAVELPCEPTGSVLEGALVDLGGAQAPDAARVVGRLVLQAADPDFGRHWRASGGRCAGRLHFP